MIRRMPRIFILLISLTVFVSTLGAESVLIINRTGRTIELIQTAPEGQDFWGDDLILGRVLEDRESITVDLIGQSSWSFRFIDDSGEVYVLYEADPSRTGKLSVGPEHLARSFILAGRSRNITINNRTGFAISNVRISAVSEENWGNDILSGSFIRDGQSFASLFETKPGTLTFDIRFTLLTDDGEISYEKPGVILTDGASIVLSGLR